MELDRERLEKRWWLYSNFDKILKEVAYHRKHAAEMTLPKLPIWSWDEKERRTNINVDTRG